MLIIHGGFYYKNYNNNISDILPQKPNNKTRIIGLLNQELENLHIEKNEEIPAKPAIKVISSKPCSNINNINFTIRLANVHQPWTE